jgi:hypothetical protein
MIAEAISAGILANAAYQILINSLKVTANSLKGKLSDWIIPSETLQSIETHIERLGIDGDMSESAIERKLSSSTEIINLLKTIQPINSTTIIQTNVHGTNIGIQNNK